MRLRRPPTLTERLLGRRQARRLRRRAGYAALATGLSLLRPAATRAAVALAGVTGGVLLLAR